MSKIREQFDRPPETPLEVSPTGDLRPFVIFTQLRKNGPHIYAGWLEAADAAMAMDFAKEHYGQDQECVGIWAIDRVNLTSSDGLYAAAGSSGGTFAIFARGRCRSRDICMKIRPWSMATWRSAWSACKGNGCGMSGE